MPANCAQPQRDRVSFGGASVIANKVKLVVWDLDDTFWQGTLLEGGIVPVEANVAIVIELSKRGIVNSICSKNDAEAAKAKLSELGVWDYFVFPAISFNPKGKAIAEMIEGAALRAENVLFLDDNPSNLEEVKFFNPGIMAAHPADALDGLLDHPNCVGKPDPKLTRLKQYRFLQTKAEERAATDLSNEEFLRASNIRVTVDYDVEANFDRVVELINRTNQLNYTKKRLETPEAIAEFRAILGGRFGVHAGCVRVVDNYGDYGLIGFFLMRRGQRGTRLIHFVFSCRTMNMGIEQYIYEQLSRPKIRIAEPVSYGLDSHAQIDWIKSGDDPGAVSVTASDRRLVLLGNCDLLMLANYCSTNRVEFVNVTKKGVVVRYDDPGFILSDRATLRESEALRGIGYWTWEDAARFDEEIARADVLLLSMWVAMNSVCYKTLDGVELWPRQQIAKGFRDRDPQWFDDNFVRIGTDSSTRLARVKEALEAVAKRSRPGARIFLLGAAFSGLERDLGRQRREQFNDACRDFCAERPGKFHYVDVDAVVGTGHLLGKTHLNRTGYFIVAQHILAAASEADRAAADPAMGEPAVALV